MESYVKCCSHYMVTIWNRKRHRPILVPQGHFDFKHVNLNFYLFSLLYFWLNLCRLSYITILKWKPKISVYSAISRFWARHDCDAATEIRTVNTDSLCVTTRWQGTTSLPCIFVSCWNGEMKSFTCILPEHFRPAIKWTLKCLYVAFRQPIFLLPFL